MLPILLSFIIPCYKSENSIVFVVEEIISTVETRQGYDYEIILVNDCSPDSVGEVIKKLCSENEKIKGISLTRNFGQHAALITGMNHASGSIVICLDDDGQTPADECFSLINELDNGYDVVFAKYKNKKHNAFRNFGSRINELMARSLINKPKKLEIMGLGYDIAGLIEVALSQSHNQLSFPLFFWLYLFDNSLHLRSQCFLQYLSCPKV